MGTFFGLTWHIYQSKIFFDNGKHRLVKGKEKKGEGNVPLFPSPGREGNQPQGEEGEGKIQGDPLYCGRRGTDTQKGKGEQPTVGERSLLQACIRLVATTGFLTRGCQSGKFR